MKLKSNRGLAAALVASTALVAPLMSVALAAAPTMAAAADAATTAPKDSTEVGEVVVTGTLFRTKVETASPVTKLTAIKLQNAGITSVADAVRSISADNSGTIPAGFGTGFAAGSQGVALRGLTVNSTLVLIDGYRTANYALADDGERGFVDLNTIPDSIIDHVDVLKDGASSQYGADAIGGVVNIILKPTFEGEEVTGETGISQHGGGAMYRATGTVGFGDLDTNRYNFYFNGEFEHDDNIKVGQRPYPFNSLDYSPYGGVNDLGGQPANFSGSIYGSVADAVTGGPTQVLAPGGCGPLGKLSSDTSGNVFCLQNRSLYDDDQGESVRYGFYSRFTAKLNDNTTAYVNASYYQSNFEVDLAPSQIQTTVPVNTDGITIPAVFTSGPNAGQLNPNDPFAALGHAALINYAFGDIPSYTIENNHVFRGVADIKGTEYGWDYEAGAVFARTWLDTVNAGYLNYNQLIADINDGAYSFIDPSSNSKAVRAALAPPLVKSSHTDLDMLNIQASHDLFELPGGTARIAIGGSYRYENTYDPDLNPNLAAEGLGIAHTIGQRNVESGFYEIDLPVIKQIEINTSGRFDHYSDFGNNFSPRVGFKWTPIRQFALRGTYSLGFRAPSFSENGSSAAEGFTSFAPDPVADAAFVAAHHGDGYVTNLYQLGVLTEANPHIKPEKSESFTVGAVIQPIRNLSLSIDYYHIKKTQVIAQPSAFTALAAYLTGQPIPAGFTVIPDAPDPLYPSALPRPSIVGAAYINANSETTDGIDLNIDFNYELPYDVKFESSFDITDLLSFDYAQPGQPVVSYVGLQSPYALSSGAGTPKWRWNWQNTVTKGPVSLTATINYVSSIKEVAADYFGAGVCASTIIIGAAPNNCSEPAFIDVDLHASYKLTDKIEVYGDVLNLMDALPPFDPINYAGTNYNPTYTQAGIVGRYFKIGMRAKF
jgi:iron complex outermembrane receptor protein